MHERAAEFVSSERVRQKSLCCVEVQVGVLISGKDLAEEAGYQ